MPVMHDVVRETGAVISDTTNLDFRLKTHRRPLAYETRCSIRTRKGIMNLDGAVGLSSRPCSTFVVGGGGAARDRLMSSKPIIFPRHQATVLRFII